MSIQSAEERATVTLRALPNRFAVGSDGETRTSIRSRLCSIRDAASEEGKIAEAVDAMVGAGQRAAARGDRSHPSIKVAT